MLHDDLKLLLSEAEAAMRKSLEHLATEMNHVRAGRATPSMLDGVKVMCYGSLMPLDQVASISAPAPDMLTIQAWDKTVAPEIEKAINQANLGLNPGSDGDFIRVPIPPLSEERRRDLAKVIKGQAEDAKVSIRNVRRSSKDDIKKRQKDQSLPEDMRFEAEEALQKLTDDSIKKVDDMFARKEKEIMEV